MVWVTVVEDRVGVYSAGGSGVPELLAGFLNPVFPWLSNAPEWVGYGDDAVSPESRGSLGVFVGRSDYVRQVSLSKVVVFLCYGDDFSFFLASGGFFSGLLENIVVCVCSVYECSGDFENLSEAFKLEGLESV